MRRTEALEQAGSRVARVTSPASVRQLIFHLHVLLVGPEMKPLDADPFLYNATSFHLTRESHFLRPGRDWKRPAGALLYAFPFVTARQVRRRRCPSDCELFLASFLL